jgi:hypothetical protein
MDAPARATYTTEDLINIELTASDPDADKIQFRVANKPDRATLKKLSNRRALFRWDPLADERTEQGDPLRLIFVAEDSHGAKDEVVHYANIFPSNGRPNFLNRSSRVVDPTQTETISVKIKVDDDDSEEVDISMESAPDGATFNQSGTHSGQFQWTPGAEQKKDRIHSVTFVADDGQFDPVTFKYTILFNRQDSSDDDEQKPTLQCSQEQLIQHTPIGPKFGLGNYEISARLSSEAQQTYDDFYVLWSTDNVFEAIQPKFKSSKLTRNGNKISGRLEAPVDIEQSPITIYYDICALNADAERGSGNRTHCIRDPFYFSLLAYKNEGASCADDGIQIDSFSKAREISTDETPTYRACSGNPDFHKIPVGAGKTLDLTVSYPGPNSVELELFDRNQNPLPDLKRSSCVGLARASLPGASPTKTYFLKVTGDNVPYQLKASRRAKDDDTTTCTRDSLEPNDSPTEATEPTEAESTFPDLSICPSSDVDLFQWQLFDGDTLATDLYFEHSNGNINAKLFGPDQQDGIDVRNEGVANGTSKTDNERLSHTAEKTGKHYLYVYSSGETTDYQLDVELSCQDSDPLGPGNHSRSSAAGIEVDGTRYENLKQCPGKPDWFSFTGFDDTTILADLELEQGSLPLSNITLEAYDSTGEKLGQGTIKGNRIELEFSPDSTDEYYIKVQAPKTFTYSLATLQVQN